MDNFDTTFTPNELSTGTPATNNYPVQESYAVAPQAQQVVYASVADSPSQDTPKGWVTLLKALLALAAYSAIETAGVVIASLMNNDYLGLMFAFTIAGSIAGVLLILALGGKQLLSWAKEPIVEAFEFAWWFIAISAGLSLLSMVSTFLDGETLGPNWIFSILWSLALCFFIGLSEETLTRGLFLNGLLARFGTTRKGVMWSCVITGLYFGLLHVTLDDVATGDPVMIGQAIGKVLQTGTYGFALAAISTRSHNVIGAALIHGLDDFLLFVSEAIFYDTDVLDTKYVSSGDDGFANIMLYVIMIALYMPVVIKAVKLLMEIPIAERGSFNLRRGLNAQAVSAQGVPAGIQTTGYVPDVVSSQSVPAVAPSIQTPPPVPPQNPVPPTGWNS